jgi:myo-inositol-1(or 4)-monophosphatase
MRTGHLLKTAVRAAQVAGEIQRKSLGKVRSIEFKGEINLVTEVDRICEEKIVKIIRREYPGHDFLTEEAGAFNRPSEFKWIIDPLDGTTNYAHGYPLFCVSIGLEYKGEIVVGVVYEPNMDQLFIGVKGQGATLNRKKIRVSKISLLKRALLATGFAYNVQTKVDNNLNHFGNFIMKAQAVRRDGVAAIDLCYVACGRFDGFWEKDLWPWDTAAASLIVEEAGGRLTRFDGSPFNVYDKEIVASNGKIHEEMLKVLQNGARSS